MRILIDILHPAHVHFFKNFIKEMSKMNHEIYITSRNKEITNYLLAKYQLNHESISSIGNNFFDLGTELFTRSCKFASICFKIKPHLLMGIMGPTIAIVGKMLKIPTFVFYDSEFAKLTNSFVYPLATKVITPSCYKNPIGKNHIKYKGYQELAYLHPDYYKSDSTVKEELGIGKNEDYFLVRLVGWKASHDIGFKGLNLKDVNFLINNLEDHGHVFVTSERPLSNNKYSFSIPPEKIHDLLFHAKMYVGEGVTMASEAAILGTPAILISPLVGNIGYLEDLEKYNLAFNFTNSERAFDKVAELLSIDNLKETWKKHRLKMLDDKVNVTNFIVEFVENYFK